jgi:hypothetical protein
MQLFVLQNGLWSGFMHNVKYVILVGLVLLSSGCISQHSAEQSLVSSGQWWNATYQHRLNISTANYASDCITDGIYPDLNCTPGAIDSRVTQDNINTTICVSGYTATVRPSSSWTNPLKLQSIIDYGYADTNMSDYEFDHMIPLEIGGCPACDNNLWAEPISVARQKDVVENYLHHQVCVGNMLLVDAQRLIYDWVSIYEELNSSVTSNMVR